MNLSEIARALGLAKSSCHRLLAALLDREVVEQDESGRYRPGLALLALGLGAQRREPVVELARPRLEAEAAALGETVFLVAARRGQLRVLDKCEGSGFLRAAPGVGDVIPPDVTATGKLYRAYSDGSEIAGVGQAVFVSELAYASELEAGERDVIRRQAYAVNRDAWIDGLSVLAVPIWQPTAASGERMAAVLALAAASPRFEVLGEAVIAGRLRAAAAEVSGRLGARLPTREANRAAVLAGAREREQARVGETARGGAHERERIR